MQRRFLNKEQCRNLMVGIKSLCPPNFTSFLVRTFKEKKNIKNKEEEKNKGVYFSISNIFKANKERISMFVFAHLCNNAVNVIK